MKTSMQQLYLEIEKFKGITDSISITDVQRMISHYFINIEKQQIIDAQENGHLYYEQEGINGEQYYIETYKNK